MMSNLKTGEGANLYDFETGRWCGVMDANGKEQDVPAADLTAADVARVRALVSGAGATDAQARAGADLGDELGAARQISDGENTGTKVRWYQPDNYSAPVWCWDLYPQSVYEG